MNEMGLCSPTECVQYHQELSSDMGFSYSCVIVQRELQLVLTCWFPLLCLLLGTGSKEGVNYIDSLPITVDAGQKWNIPCLLLS